METLEKIAILIAIALWLSLPSPLRRAQAVAVVLLMLALAVEVTGSLMRSRGTNQWIYNIYIPLDFLLLALLATPSFKPRLRRMLTVTSAVLCAGALTIAFTDPGRIFINDIFLFGALLSVLLLTVSLFTHATKSDGPLFREPFFWLMMGQLVYFGGMLPYNGLLNYLMVRDAPLAERLSFINPLLATVRYGSMGVAFAVARHWIGPIRRA